MADWTKLLVANPSASDIASSPTTGKVLKVKSDGGVEWGDDSGGSFETVGTVASFTGTVIKGISTDAGSSGPTLQLNHNSPSPADNDIVGTIDFLGNTLDDQDAIDENDFEFAKIYTKVTTVETNIDKAEMVFQVDDDGLQDILKLTGQSAFISGATVGNGNAVLSVKQTNAYASPYTQHIMELKNNSNDVKFRVRTDGQVFFNSVQPMTGTGMTMYAGGAQTHAKVDNNLFTWNHSGTEYMRLDTSTGRLGIGTNNPAKMLELYDTGGAAQLQITRQTGNNFVRISEQEFAKQGGGGGTTPYKFKVITADPMSFSTSNTERMRIHKDGNILIGTTTAESLRGITTQVQVEGVSATSSSISVFRNSNNDAGPYLILGKSRGATVNADTIVQNGDSLGYITWVGADGVDRANYGAIIAARVDGATGENSLATRLVFSTNAGSGIPTDRMFIKSDGKVGIGTDSPSSHLHIRGTTPQIILQNDGQSNYLAMYHIAGLARIFTEGSAKLHLGAAGNGDRLRIATDGKVGIGVDPSEQLHVAGSGANMRLESTDSNNTTLQMYANGGQRMFLQATASTSVIGAESIPLQIRSSGATNPILFTTYDSGWYDRMIITKTGKVGIGVTPHSSTTLHIKSTASTVLAVDGDNAQWQILSFRSEGSSQAEIGHYKDTRMQFSHTAGAFRWVHTNASNMMELNGTGLGIGTISPSYKLDILHAGDAQFRVGFSAAKYVAIRDDVMQFTGMTGNGMRILTSDAADIKIGTNNTTDKLVIKSGGNVGIGTADPKELLDISAGRIRLDNDQGLAWSTDDSKIGRVQIFGNESSDTIIFRTDNATRLTVGAGTSTFTGILDAYTYHIGTDPYHGQIKATGGGNIEFHPRASYDFNFVMGSNNAFTFSSSSLQNGADDIGGTTKDLGGVPVRIYSTEPSLTIDGSYSARQFWATRDGGTNEKLMSLEMTTDHKMSWKAYNDNNTIKYDDMLVLDGSTGKVAIGHDSPDHMIHTYGSTGIKMESNSAGAGMRTMVEGPWGASNGGDGGFQNMVLDATGAARMQMDMRRVSTAANGDTVGDYAYQWWASNADGGLNFRMKLNRTGLGLGTQNPQYKLDVRHAGSGPLRLTGASSKASGSNTYAYFQTTDASNEMCLMIKSTANSYFEFQAMEQNIAYRDIVFCKDGGRVGIGETSPAYDLHVDGTAKVSDTIYSNTFYGLAADSVFASGADLTLRTNNNGSNKIAFRSRGYADGGGGTYTWTTGGQSSGSGETEKMRLSALGYLGIGTSAPENVFTVHGSGNSPVTIKTFSPTAASGINLITSKGTEGSPTDINANNYRIGQIQFMGRESNGDRPGASIEAFTASVWTGTGHATNMRFYTGDGTQYAMEERVRISSGGDLYLNGNASPKAGIGFINNNIYGTDIWCNNSVRFKIENYGGLWSFRSNQGNGPAMASTISSDTTAVFRPRGQNINTGMGGGLGEVDLITDGVARLTASNTGIEIPVLHRQDHIANTLPQPYYKFDGVDDYINVGSIPIDEEPFSIFCWISIDGYSAGSKFMFGNASNFSQAFGLHAAGSTYKLRFECGGTGTQVNGSETIPHDNSWHFVGVTLQEDGTLQFYIDGVASGSTSSYDKAYTATSNYYIGQDRNGAFFKGLISNLSVYNTTLSASDIQTLYAGGAVPYKYKDVKLAPELVPNGTFASDLTGWGAKAGGGTTAVVSHDSSVGRTANGSAKCVLASDSANTGISTVTTYIPSVTGKSFYLSAWIYQASGSTKQFYVGFYDNNAWEYVAEFADVPTGVWTQLSGTITNTKSHSQGTIAIISGNAGAAHTYWVDDIQMHRIGAVAEYDGSGATNATWYDKSGNDLDGTINGGVILENSKGFGNIRFDNGKVGIGTDSPADKLQITSPAYNSTTVDPDYFKAFKLQIEGDNYWAQQAQFKLGRWENVSGSHSRSSLVIALAHAYVAESANADVDVMTLLSSGNVGIGTTSPTAPLHIKTDMATNTNTDALKVEGDYLLAIIGGDDALYNSAKLELYRDGSTKNVHLSGANHTSYPSYILGRLGIGATAPDRTLEITASDSGDTAIHIDSGASAWIEIDRSATGQTSEIKYMTNGSTNFHTGVSSTNAGFGTKYFIGNKSGMSGASPNAFFVIETDGKVGIGANNPSAKTEINNVVGDAQTALLVNQDNNASKALEIDSETQTQYSFHINNPAQTTGHVVGIEEANNLTTGKIFNIVTNSATTNDRDLFSLKNEHASSTGTTLMHLVNNSTGNVLHIEGQSVIHENGTLDAEEGSARVIEYIARNQTTDGSASECFLNGSSTRLTVPDGATWFFSVRVVARRVGGQREDAGYHYEGVIENDGGTTALVGTVNQLTLIEDVGSWVCTITADDTNDSLKIGIKGEASKDINWVAYVRIVQTQG